jgi:hypothetical protein
MILGDKEETKKRTIELQREATEELLKKLNEYEIPLREEAIQAERLE